MDDDDDDHDRQSTTTSATPLNSTITVGDSGDDYHSVESEEDSVIEENSDDDEDDDETSPPIEKVIESAPKSRNQPHQDQQPKTVSFDIEPRRSKQTTAGQPPERLGSTKLMSAVDAEPSSWKDVQHLPRCQRELWKKAAEKEIKLLHEYRVWDLVDPPPKREIITCRWVFKTKLDADGRPRTYKARLVARGFSQKFGEDYDETYAPVVRYNTVRVLLAVAAMKKMYVQQLDVQSTYLNGDLEEEIFMEQLPEFVQRGQENKAGATRALKVRALRRAL
ncbi:retrovirus-related pol polyprotein from transposon tnt 1-94 [Lasius niger]|uniref:Retrovirus-related pol polyprotein from transposon tnt 1-94 n=1 Tax=Lasius niger TaxID=67767 RepID=A0A0J7KNL7_LASNI|nr:retrovirus-related pol polyprotein from transposon tnt 1-94 [Lasius niger]